MPHPAGTRFKGPVSSDNGFQILGDVVTTGAVSATGNITGAAFVSAGALFSLKAVLSGTVSINPADLPANTSAETAVTITGAATGDIVIMNIPASLETGLAYSGVRVSASNTVQVRLSNITGSSVNGAALDWTYLILRPTTL